MEDILIATYNFLTYRKCAIFLFFCFVNSLVFKKHSGERLPEEAFKVIEVGSSKTKFYKVTNESIKTNYLQLHIPFIVDELFHLDKDIEYMSGSVKFIIRPFKEIFMIKDGKKVSIGNFSRSFLENDNYVQVFEHGDRCSYNKKIRWSAKVQFYGSVEKLKVVKLIEGNLCNYEIKVVGNNLTRKIMNKDTIYFKSNTESSEEEKEEVDEDDLDMENLNQQFKTLKMKLLGGN